MSRHPSPGPSHPQTFHQPPLAHSAPRQKPSRPPVGITAGVEDTKYQAKYRELKRKVKEIETDNDKLHWRVLQAKRNIQRMKFERAILYERLGNLPLDDRNTLQALHTAPGLPPPPPSHTSQLGHPLRDYPHPADDHPLGDYPRPTQRVASGSEGRPPILDSSIPPPPGVPPSSRSVSSSHPSRRGSAGSIPPLPPLPPPPHLPPVQHLDIPRGHSHSSHSSHSHSSPHMHHPSSSHERTSHSRDQLQSLKRGFAPSQQYPEPLPPVQHVLHSPPLSETERARRHDIHELAGSPHDHHPHTRHQPPMIPLSPHHSTDSRSTGRMIHAHQRMGPGTYINRGDEYPDRDPLDRDRDWENERGRDHVQRIELSSAHTMHSPPSQRARHRNEYPEHHPTSRVRDDQGYYQEGPGPVYPVVSRDGTPVSIAEDRPSRPDSRAAQHYYDQEQQPSQRPRSFRLRPVPTGTVDDIDFVHEDGRGQRDRGGISGGGAAYPEQNSRSNMDSRKRSRNDDGESDILEGSVGSSSGGGGTYSGARLPDDRGSKRYHRDSHLGRDDES